jgi:hypothetical protein
LSYALDKKYISSVKILCEYLSQGEDEVILTKNDFEYLLESNHSYCHKVLALIPKQTELSIYPILMDMGHPVKLFYSNNVKESYNEIKKLERTPSKYNCFQKNEPDEKDVITYEIPFKYSFAAGSLESIKFLYNFSESHDEDFLLSQWKNVVLIKWREQLPLQIFMSVVYWLFTIFVMTSMIFAKETVEVKYISLLLMGVLLIFEFLQFISYCNFNITM